MAYKNFVIRVDRRQTRSHDPETDQIAFSSIKIGGDSGVEINSTNLVTNSNTTTFTNKTFDVDGTGNSLTNIANANIKAAAGIVESKLSLDYGTTTLNTAISNAQSEINAIEAAMGAVIDTAGSYVAHTGTNFLNGNANVTEDLLDLDTAVGDLTFAPSNYTDPASNTVSAHLQNIDSALASAAVTVFDDATFKIVDSDGDSLGILFDVSAITTADKTITVPDSNINLGDIGTNASSITDLQGALGAASEAAINYTSNNYVTDASDLVTAVSALDSQMAALASTISNFEWQASVKDYVTDNTLAPATEVSGDRYLLSHDGGTPHENWDGALAGDIVEFNGSSWVAITPTTGTFVAADDQPNVLYLWGGSSWSSKAFEATTASTGLTKSGFDIQLADAVANTGIVVSSGSIAAVYDDSSIGINGSEQLYVKALGITDGMLAGSISDSKLASDYVQTSEVDDSSIEWSGTVLQVKALGITNAMLAGSITDSKLNQITTANKVAGSAVQLSANGGLEDSTGLQIATGGVTEDMLAKTRPYTASGWTNGSGTQAVKGNIGFVDTDGLVKPAGAGTTDIYKKRLVVCADATIDNSSSGNWYALPIAKIGAASGESGMTVGEEVYLSSTEGQIEQTITNITSGHAIVLMGYAIAAADWEYITPRYLGDA